MEEHWFTRLKVYLCAKLKHPLVDKGWVFNGKYHRNCRVCKRIISVPVNH